MNIFNFKNLISPKKHKKKVSRENEYTSSVKVRTQVSDLAVGMYVIELDKPWLESSFIFQGFEIKNQEDIAAVRKECDFVYIDRSRQSVKKLEPVAINVKQNKSENFGVVTKNISNVEDEIENAEVVINDTRSLVSDFMEKVANGEGVDSGLAKQAVSECVNSVLHSPDAVIWFSQLKNKHEYTAQHSMNVCVLSIVLGRQISLSTQDLNRVGLCGMMHDMGKMLIPAEIIDKPGKLEPEEMQIMQSHTTLGYDLLKSSHNMFPGAIDTAYSHHERLDRQGYPRKIDAEKITQFTRIVAIADMYDAITSDRVYQKGRTHLEATNIMSNQAGKHLDQQLVYKFIESLGVYPPGSFVMLSNGEIAVIVEVNPEIKLRPKIIIILNQERQSVPEKVLDLATMPRDELGEHYYIKGIVHAMEYGIDAKKYYHKGLIQKGFSAIK